MSTLKNIKTRIIAVLCFAVMCEAMLCGFVSAPSAAKGAAKIKAVTYFGNEWQINFWNCEHSQALEDFRRIKNDGFNSVIFVVPWNEFQPSLSDNGFNDRALIKLDTLMGQAEKAGLSVILRVGYTWDYYPGGKIADRYRQLIYDQSVRNAWKSYAAKIYSVASKHANFGGAFLTWEDFWNFVSEEASIPAGIQARNFSKTFGFYDYVSQKYTAEQIAQYYDSEEDRRFIPFPQKNDKAYVLFYEWYDHVLMDILADTQTVFPNISMECRLDIDSTQSPSGIIGYDHQQTFGCAGASYSSVMLSANMGFEAGVTVSADQAANHGAVELNRVKQAGKKPVFIDQFLYMETTPGYENNAKLSPSSINSYLGKMGSVINQRSIGYGLWTYKDYADNIIYNPEFGCGLEGWSASKGVTVENCNGTNMVLIDGGSISQNVSMRAYLSTKPTKLSFRAVTDTDTVIKVKVGGQQKSIEKPAGDHVVEVEFDKIERGNIVFVCDKKVFLDDIKLYSHITEGNVYHIDGGKGDYLSGIRAMNKQIN